MNCIKKRILPIVLIISLSFLSVFADEQDKIKQKMFQLIENGALLLNDEEGNALISHNAEELLVPASIIKILTSFVAIDILEKNYCYKTEFFKDVDNNLAIKGWGDPYLISEEIAIITDTLKKKGITRIKQLFLDNSSFASGITVPGVSHTLNPYDAINAALVVNFNTINIRKRPNGEIFSGESVTPLTPLAIKKGKAIWAGSKQRINLTENEDESLQYVGELFSAFFKKAGIKIGNRGIIKEKVDDSWELFYTHCNSRKLTELVTGLLKYSNNFIANQLFLTIGAERVGVPATLENATDFFKRYVNLKLNTPLSEFAICEGSGISRNNLITGNVMIMIMEKFRMHADYLSTKYGALVQSGTLTGVNNYAGYIKTEKGLRPFVIILNQKKNYRDRILKLLIRYCEN